MPAKLISLTLIVAATLLPGHAGAAHPAALEAPVGGAIDVDGDLSDWGPDTRWHPLTFHEEMLGDAPQPEDAEARVALQYDREAGQLFVAMQVRDDIVLTDRQQSSLPRGIGQNPDGVLLYLDPGHRATFAETIELSFVERPLAADEALLPPGVIEIARALLPGGMTAEWRIDLAGLFAHRELVWNSGDHVLGFDAVYFDRDGETDGSILMLSPGPHDGIDNRRLGDLFLLESPRSLARLTGKVRWPDMPAQPAHSPATVRLRSAVNPGFEVHASTEADGSFTVTAPTGSYTAFALDSRVLVDDARPTSVALGAGRTDLGEPLVAPARPTDLDRLIPKAMEDLGVHTVGVAWLKDGEIAYERSFGTRADEQPAGPDTRFRVASITKAITTMTVLDMARTGDWDLDRPLADFWMDPDIAADPRSRRLTTRMVLRHLTGLPNWREGGALRFIDEPGAHQHYSGEGFELLRKAIEAASGESLEEIARDRIFAPAGMAATSYRWSDDTAAGFAGEFHANGAAVEHYDGDEINAAANLLATPRDLIRFAQWTFDWTEANPGLLAELAEANSVGLLPSGNANWARHGLGWLVHSDDRVMVLEHSGGQQGIRTLLVLVPGRREAVAILTNSTGGWPLVRMIFDASVNRDNSLARTSGHLFSDLDE